MDMSLDGLLACVITFLLACLFSLTILQEMTNIPKEYLVMGAASIMLSMLFGVAIGAYFLNPLAFKRKSITEQRKVANDFVKSIMTNFEEIQKSKEIPNDGELPPSTSSGMSVLRDVVNLETGMRCNIVIRSITQPFWQACIDTVGTIEARCHVCVVGTPGIGKTASTPILIRMLLKARLTVVYHVRTKNMTGWYREFTPDKESDKVTTNVYPETTNVHYIASLADSSTYYIVDPGKTKDDCCPDSNFKPKVILVTSPDERHWGESEFIKERNRTFGTFKYFPLWSFDELLNAAPFLAPQLPQEISKALMEKRYHTFGGVPRHIFASKQVCREALRSQRAVLIKLTEEQAQSIAKKEMDAVGSMSKNQPKSALIGYELSKSDFALFVNNKKVLFQDFDVVVISAGVANIIYTKFIKRLWWIMLKPMYNGGMIFEMFTHHLLSAAKPHKFHGRACVGIKDKLYSVEKQFTLGGCTGIQQVRDIITAARNEPNVIFHSTDPQYPLIDFIYQDKLGDFHAFQATLTASPSADTNQIKVLQGKVGGGERLHLYYMVPSEMFDNFSTLPVNPGKTIGGSCEIWHLSVLKP
jgi:hypothetical protein